VNAVHARFDSSGGGGILPVGQAAEAIIGQVTCEAIGGPTGPPQALPPPTTPPAPTTTLVVGTGPKLADTGADSMLPFAVLVLGLGGILGRAVRSASRRPT